MNSTLDIGLTTHALLMTLCLIMCSSCATTRPAFDTASDQRDYDEAEINDLVLQADRYELDLVNKGLILNDPDLEEYLDGVARKVLPSELRHHHPFNYRVLRDPTINAFALPNRSIFFHSGLLARLRNEAQLAFVIGHEAIHISNFHMVRNLENLKKQTVRAKMGDLLLSPLAIYYAGGLGSNLASTLVGLSYLTAVNGYGRDLEQESDEVGLRLIRDAGYDMNEAINFFAVLNEIRDLGNLETFFYSDHPNNSQRAEYLRELAATAEFATDEMRFIGEDIYQSIISEVIIDNIELRIVNKHFNFALDEIETARLRIGDRAILYCLSGDAYRRMAEDPQSAAQEHAMRELRRADKRLIKDYENKVVQHQNQAIENYTRALEMDADMLRAYRGLGLLAFERGDFDTARNELMRYLNSNANIPDRKYISSIVKEISK